MIEWNYIRKKITFQNWAAVKKKKKRILRVEMMAKMGGKNEY